MRKPELASTESKCVSFNYNGCITPSRPGVEPITQGVWWAHPQKSSGFEPKSTRWFKVTKGIVRIVVVVGEGIAVLKEPTDLFDRDGESETLAGRDLHVRDPDDIAP